MHTVRKIDARDWAREAMRGVANVIIPSYSADMIRLNERAIRHDVHDHACASGDDQRCARCRWKAHAHAACQGLKRQPFAAGEHQLHLDHHTARPGNSAASGVERHRRELD